VHLVNGAFGTLCVGLFASDGGLFFGGGFAKTMTQLIGIGAVGALTFPLSLAAWTLLKTTMGIRVSKAEEIEGLDTGEHGMEAYGGFVMNPAEMLSEIV
jgi:Amt family ammonium transporter